jgi:hypothetical protein
MAMSPAKAHLARAAAREGSAGAGAPRPTVAATEAYLLQRAALGVDLRQLREIQSTERKIEAKRLMLPAYDPWIAGVMEADANGKGGAQDDIVTHIMIWRIDVGDYEAAIPLAEYVLRHNLILPERFQRTAATLITEETAEAALQAIGQDTPFDIEILRKVDDLVDVYDMPDQVRAKLEKAMGLVLGKVADALEPDADGVAGGKRAAYERAGRHFRRAQELNSSSGVKKEINRVEREIRKLVDVSVEEEQS